MKLTNLLIIILIFVAFVSCFWAENSVKPSSVVEFNGKFVARPASARQVKWPVYDVGVKDYLQVLREVWREMPELKEEAFVRNAGYTLLGMNYTNRGILRGDLRKTKLQEFEVVCGGQNRVGELAVEFSSAEEGTLFYDMELALHGRLDTVG